MRWLIHPNFAFSLPGQPRWETLLPIVSVLLIYWLRLRELGTGRRTIPGRVLERRTLTLLVLVGSFMVVAGLGEFLWRGGGLRGWSFAAGWACAAGSFALRRWAIATLGRFWSLHVEIRAEHELVRGGPFRWVRHPTYLSMVLELLAAGLLLHAYVALLVSLLVFVPALCWRVRLEEVALVEKFGAAYEEYTRSTPALFPYKWPAAS